MKQQQQPSTSRRSWKRSNIGYDTAPSKRISIFEQKEINNWAENHWRTFSETNDKDNDKLS